MKKIVHAFTLAEVLITLGIIGIVAAMTLPTLIANHQSKVLHTQLKEGYSLISQGLQRMQQDMGYTITIPFTDENFYDLYKIYFNKIYECPNLTPDPKVCMSRGGTNTDDSYTTLNMKTKLLTAYLDDGQFVLQNGQLVMINHYPTSSEPILISIDVNGKKRGPNSWGRDLFTFQLMNDGKLTPMGFEGTYFTDLNTYCSPLSNNSANGIACASLALTDKDYFKKYQK